MIKELVGSLSSNDGDGYKKHHLKSVFAPLQTLSCLFHLVHFIKCWRIFRELNSKVQEKRKRVKLGSFMS